MKTIFTITALLVISINCSFSQDTFSIVAVDSTTGEVGSAGASCVDLFQTSQTTDHFIGKLVPGVGAINTQAWYLPANQTNATNQMNLGQTPSQIIQWLVANDVQGQPDLRQYGIAALINGSPETDAHTGASTDDYKNHIIGPNYAIQGNILLGQQVLDSMEARFLNEEGDLACKLMAALQGANMVGADTRCSNNGTSSLFAYVKVAQPTDVFGSPSFVVSVRTPNNAGIEPIDSLQIKFDGVHLCGDASLNEGDMADDFVTLSPNPFHNFILIESRFENLENCHFGIYNLGGELILEDQLAASGKVNLEQLNPGVYFITIKLEGRTLTKKIVKT